MSSFHLQVVTPDGQAFEGQAQRVFCRTITGDVCILPRHCDYMTALGMGEARITDEAGQVRRAACIGGMLSVVDGHVTLLPSTFEWSDQIDVERADASYRRADAVLHDKNASETDLKLAEARLRRALIRKSVASSK